ncbi:MAG: methyltransferase [Candidatus Aminicenantes bacterium RBG_13_59_9]|nr:MAG: methyltransferase [Candidatus Aminicenantes bacterium RBG_13_59_9]
MDLYEEISAAVQKGDAGQVKALVEKTLAQDLPVDKVLNKGLIAGMNVIGERFKAMDIFIPEVLVSARAMNMGLDIIKPLLAKANVKAKGKVVIGTVRGDLHDIGKNIVAMMLRGAGYEVIDLGADVPKEKFLENVKKESADVVAMSALLTTTMTYMREIIEELEKAKLKTRVKVIIGGAPLSQAYADKIKADGYAPDAALAVDLLKKLLKK